MLSTALLAQAVEKISILGLFKDKAIINVDGKRRVLASGQTSPEGVTLIAADSRKAVLEIDGRQATYALGAGFPPEISTQKAQKPSARSYRCWHNPVSID